MNPVVLFDGECNLCAASVQWIIRRDPQAQFRFAALGSEAGRHLVSSLPSLPDSIVLVDEAGVHTQSTAALRIAARLTWPWSWARLAFLVPRALRDAIYRWIARNRYRWFGKRQTCWLPSPDLVSRFL